MPCVIMYCLHVSLYILTDMFPCFLQFIVVGGCHSLLFWFQTASPASLVWPHTAAASVANWVPRTKAAVSVAGGRPWIAAMSSRPLRTCAAACDAARNTTLIKIACCPSFLVELFGCDPSALCEAVELDGASTYCPHQLHARHALRSLN